MMHGQKTIKLYVNVYDPLKDLCTNCRNHSIFNLNSSQSTARCKYWRLLN